MPDDHAALEEARHLEAITDAMAAAFVHDAYGIVCGLVRMARTMALAGPTAERIALARVMVQMAHSLDPDVADAPRLQS